MTETFVIADIGANHDAEFPLMLEAIYAARDAGATAVKFQWVSDPVRMAARRGAAQADGYSAIYARYLCWPEELHARLKERCQAVGLEYMCTAFLPEDVAVVAPHVSLLKVASFDALQPDLHAANGRTGKTVLISTGMLYEKGARAVQKMAAAAYGGDYNRIKMLHCVSAYPAPHTALHLSLMVAYDGLSDHTYPTATWTGALAVAAGARYIEAHLRLKETDPTNPDYPHAMDPKQFREYVGHIRYAEQCLGDWEADKEPHAVERAMARYLGHAGTGVTG